MFEHMFPIGALSWGGVFAALHAMRMRHGDSNVPQSQETLVPKAACLGLKDQVAVASMLVEVRPRTEHWLLCARGLGSCLLGLVRTSVNPLSET